MQQLFTYLPKAFVFETIKDVFLRTSCRRLFTLKFVKSQVDLRENANVIMKINFWVVSHNMLRHLPFYIFLNDMYLNY